MRNEEYMLPYFLRHYETFADKIFIFDDHSTDRTVEIARDHNKTILQDFKYNRGMNEDDFNDCFEKSYKKYSRDLADWVICVDGDEFIYNKNVIGVLKEQKERGVQVIQSIGYMMVSEVLPQKKGQIYEESKKGIRFPKYDKTVIFDPSLDITFGEGRHTTNIPRGAKVAQKDLLLLHYRYLSKEYFLERSNMQWPRTNMDDKTINYRMKRGVAWYKRNLKSPKLKEVI